MQPWSIADLIDRTKDYAAAAQERMIDEVTDEE